MSDASLKDAVRDAYGRAALRVAAGAAPDCCRGTDCSAVEGNLYDPADLATLPDQAVLGSLGCGNPTALAELRAGDTVLDLGSGGGLDVLLSARRVAPGGMAYGLDMTDETLTLAREHHRRAGVTNAEFLKGDIEHIPLPEGSVDVIISNCVINLSADKPRVLVWNKVDMLDETAAEQLAGQGFMVSALDRATFGPLLLGIERTLWQHGVDAPVARGHAV